MTCSSPLLPSHPPLLGSPSTSSLPQCCRVFFAAPPPPPPLLPPSLSFLRAPGGAARGPVVAVLLHRPQPGPPPQSGRGPGPPPPPVLLPPRPLPKLAHLRPGPPRMPLRLACLAPPSPWRPPPSHTRVELLVLWLLPALLLGVSACEPAPPPLLLCSSAPPAPPLLHAGALRPPPDSCHWDFCVSHRTSLHLDQNQRCSTCWVDGVILGGCKMKAALVELTRTSPPPPAVCCLNTVGEGS